MSSDVISGDITVVGIQGNAVSSATPSDGYVLTWDNADGYWTPKPVPASGGLREDYFTSNGTWTCPEGITNILVIGSGAGAGGWYGSGNGGSGTFGNRAFQISQNLTVVPGLNYSIIIGAGGNGGIGSRTYQPDNFTSATNISGTSPTSGGSTQFKYGSTILISISGALNTYANSFPIYTDTYSDGINGTLSYTGGTDGLGGLGGKSGSQGNGGNGGNGSASTGGTPSMASNGSNASNNSGAGGGGGGGCGQLTTPYDSTGGNGGNGGSGYLYIIY